MKIHLKRKTNGTDWDFLKWMDCDFFFVFLFWFWGMSLDVFCKKFSKVEDWVIST